MSPRRQHLVRRARLNERLSAGLHHPLTVIVAPAGWGKTTLLGDWCDEQQAGTPEPLPSIAWLALDEGDNDLARFLRYVIAALQGVHPDLVRPTPANLGSQEVPSPEAFLTLLLNDLAGLPQDVVLVLDDYHLITSTPIHAALGFLLDHLPPRMHLFIATRSDPPLPLPRLRARGQLVEVRAADLRFTHAEAATFLEETMHLGGVAEEVAALEARTEGWIAGLQLAALALQGHGDSRTFIEGFTGSHRYIADFLLEEVFRRLPERVQIFLLHTSILHRLTGSLCDHLTGEQDGDAMLEHLERANLFVFPLDMEHSWYRYHRLFAELLRHQLQQQGAEHVRALHRCAAEWFEQQAHEVFPERHSGRVTGRPSGWDMSLITEAIDHALAAQDWERAAGLIENIADIIMWQRGERASMHRWLAAIPDEITRSRPRLCLVQAWASLWSGRLDAVESHLSDAESAIADDRRRRPGPLDDQDARASARAIRGELAAIGAELAHFRGDLTRSLDLSHRALENLRADEKALRGIAMAVQADAHAASGEVIAATRVYQDASASLEGAGRLVPALVCGGHLTRLQAMQGQLHQAAETYEEVRQRAEAYGLERSPALGMAMVWMGDILREWNDLGAAREYLVDGIALGRQWEALAEHMVAGAISLARVHQASGDLRAAHRVLEEQLRRPREHDARGLGRLAAYRARLWLAEGRIAAAAQWARNAGLDGNDEPNFHRESELVTLARILVVHEEWDQAARMLSRLCHAAEAGGRLSTVIETLVLQALASEGRGDPAEASRLLEQALTLAEPGGYIRIFLDEGAHLAALLRRIDPRGIVRRYLDTLLAAFDGRDARARVAGATAVGEVASCGLIQPLVDALSERELEVLRLIAAGRSNREIARELIVTVGTVKKHINNIFGKLRVQSRTQSVARARELRLLP